MLFALARLSVQYKLEHMLDIYKPNKFNKNLLLESPEEFLENLRKQTGWKCDELIINSSPVEKHLTKGKSYCISNKYYAMGSKGFEVKTLTIDLNTGSILQNSFESPFYVSSLASELTCDDCDIKLNPSQDNSFQERITFSLINKDNADFNFKLPAGTTAYFDVINSKELQIMYSKDEETEQTEYHGGILFDDNKEHNVKVKVSLKSASRKVSAITYPSLLGRVPATGMAYAKEDLEKEFSNPNTVTQENSIQGPGKTISGGSSGSGGSSESGGSSDSGGSSGSDGSSESGGDSEINCKGNVKNGISTIPKGSTYCNAEGSMFIGTKHKLEVTAIDITVDQNGPKIASKTTYNNPDFVKTQLTALKCTDKNDCKVQIYNIKEGVEEKEEQKKKSFTVVALSTSKATINIELNNDYKKAIFSYYNSKPSLLTFTQNEKSANFTQKELLFPFYLTKDEKEAKVTINISEPAATSDDAEWLLPEVVGRVPEKPGAYTTEALSQEYHQPGSAKPMKPIGLTPGAIAGIVIAVIVVIAIICVLVYFFVFRKRSDKSSSSDKKKEEP